MPATATPEPLTIADLETIAEELRVRLAEKDPDKYPLVSIGVRSNTVRDPQFYVSLYGTKNRVFDGVCLDDAVAKARAWLDHDEKAEANRAIGLAADGSLLAEAAQ